MVNVDVHAVPSGLAVAEAFLKAMRVYGVPAAVLTSLHQAHDHLVRDLSPLRPNIRYSRDVDVGSTDGGVVEAHRQPPSLRWCRLSMSRWRSLA